MSSIFFDIQPEISVIICTYNRAEHLTRCIESVIAQTFQDWELIIVDDGSSDRTFDVINPYLEQFPTIRYLKHKNRGAAYARNAGIVASLGDYITFLDSDDTYAKNHLESRLAYLKAHPELDLIQGGLYTGDNIFVVDYYQPKQLINLKDCAVAPTFFGKRQVFFDLQGFNDILYGEDADLWERAGNRFTVETVKSPETYHYTRADSSITQQILEQRSQPSTSPVFLTEEGTGHFLP
ncbi:glycosyltransferase family 2 protein [Spirulina major]|uniref:glycosyltransferase family 2 protein n=1 Tax=Spirulina major TaxID=270636 RepID=UPI000933EFD3|nr:glycosyltransferase family A protein [Spirulina major]